MSALRFTLLGSAVSALLYLIAVQVPWAAFPVSVGILLPGLLLGLRYTERAAAVWAALTMGLLALSSSVWGGLGFAASFGVLAYVVAAGAQRGYTLPGSMALGLVAWVAAIVGLVSLATNPADLVEHLRGDLRESVEAAIAASQEQAAGLDPAIVTDATLSLLPAILALSGALLLFFDIAIARRFVEAFPQFEFKRWHAPEAVLWVSIASGFAMLLPADAVRITAMNVLVLASVCFFAQGLALIAFFLAKINMPTALRVLVYTCSVLQPVIGLLVTLGGVADCWLDFRGVRYRVAQTTASQD